MSHKKDDIKGRVYRWIWYLDNPKFTHIIYEGDWEGYDFEGQIIKRPNARQYRRIVHHAVQSYRKVFKGRNRSMGDNRKAMLKARKAKRREESK